MYAVWSDAITHELSVNILWCHSCNALWENINEGQRRRRIKKDYRQWTWYGNRYCAFERDLCQPGTYHLRYPEVYHFAGACTPPQGKHDEQTPPADILISFWFEAHEAGLPTFLNTCLHNGDGRLSHYPRYRRICFLHFWWQLVTGTSWARVVQNQVYGEYRKSSPL